MTNILKEQIFYVRLCVARLSARIEIAGCLSATSACYEASRGIVL